MLKRSVTFILAAAVLALLVGDHLSFNPTSPVDRLFGKYKAKHEAVRAEITDVGEELREILRTREKTPAPRIYIALLAELARLKSELKLIESWDNGSLDRAESAGLMADSLLVLEYLHMTAAYAKSINRVMKEQGTGRTIASEDSLDRAAGSFPEVLRSMSRGDSPFQDPDILSRSHESQRLIPIAEALFQEGDPKAAAQYRIRFFARYADNIIEKNRAKLEAFQKGMVRAGSLSTR